MNSTITPTSRVCRQITALRKTTATQRRSPALCPYLRAASSLSPSHRPAAQAPSTSLSQLRGQDRAFHASPDCLKKKDRSEGKVADVDTEAEASNGDGPKHPQPKPEEPLDFADVKSRMAKHDGQARGHLQKVKLGGRFNPDTIGGLRVQMDRKEAEAHPLRELAAVVPQGGRTISILVHEASYVKPIMSAIQASRDFNQQPQRSDDNNLELILKVEPESRDDVAKKVKSVCHEWRERIRAVRQKRDKLHKEWVKAKMLLSDMKRDADKELEKLIKAKMTEIDIAEKEALKAVI